MKQKICFNLMATLAILLTGSAQGMQKTSAAKSAKATTTPEPGCQFTIKWDPETSMEQSSYFDFKAENISTLGSINEKNKPKQFSAYTMRLRLNNASKPFDTVALFMATDVDEGAEGMPLRERAYRFKKDTYYQDVRQIKGYIQSIQLRNGNPQSKINNAISTVNVLTEPNKAWIELYNYLAKLINETFTDSPQITIDMLPQKEEKKLIATIEQPQIAVTSPVKQVTPQSIKVETAEQKRIPLPKPIKSREQAKDVPSEEKQPTMPTDEPAKKIITQKQEDEVPTAAIPEQEFNKIIDTFKSYDPNKLNEAEFKNYMDSMNRIDEQGSEKQKSIFNKILNEESKITKNFEEAPDISTPQEEAAPPLPPQEEPEEELSPIATPTIIEKQQAAPTTQLPPITITESPKPATPQSVIPSAQETMKIPEKQLKEETTSTLITASTQTSIPNPIEKTTPRTTAPETSEIATTTPTQKNAKNIAPITETTHRVATSLNATTKKLTESSQASKIDSQSSSQFQSHPVSQSRPNELRRGALNALAVTKNTAAWVAAKLTGTHYLSQEASPELNEQLKKLNETNILKNKTVSIGGKDYTLAKEFNAIETAGYSINNTSKIGDENHYEIYLMPDDAHFVDFFEIISSLLATDPDLKDYIAFVALRPTDEIYDSYGLTSYFSRQVLPRIIICFKTGTENAHDKVKKLVTTVNNFITSKQPPFDTMQPARYHPRNSQKLTDYIFVGFGSPDYKKLHPDDFERHTIWGGLRSADNDMAYPKDREDELKIELPESPK